MRIGTIILVYASLAAAACREPDARGLAPSETQRLRQECRDQRMRDAETCSHDLKICMEAQTVLARGALVTEVGKTYVVGIGDRVVIENRKPLHDGVRRWRRGDDCRLDPDGTMTVIASRLTGDPPDTWTEYLVRYARPPSSSLYYIAPKDDAKPFACPDGTTFYHDDPLFIAEDP